MVISIIWYLIWKFQKKQQPTELMRTFPAFSELHSTWPQNRANMLLKLNKTAILLCLLAISCDARRRSRIDLPVTKAADAMIEDNVVTASTPAPAVEKIEAEKLEAPTTVMSEISDEDKVSESNSSEESPSYEDCELDNISFEMITGWEIMKLCLRF